jgi:hypothetical protein
MMILSDEPRCQDSINHVSVFPLARDILFAQNSIIGIVIPSSILFTSSTLYSFSNPISPCDQLLNHVLASGVDIDYRVGQEYISPSREGKFHLDTYNPTSTLGLPEGHHYSLMNSKFSSSTRELHYLMV